jgi:hypothetical protein
MAGETAVLLSTQQLNGEQLPVEPFSDAVARVDDSFRPPDAGPRTYFMQPRGDGEAAVLFSTAHTGSLHIPGMDLECIGDSRVLAASDETAYPDSADRHQSTESCSSDSTLGEEIGRLCLASRVCELGRRRSTRRVALGLGSVIPAVLIAGCVDTPGQDLTGPACQEANCHAYNGVYAKQVKAQVRTARGAWELVKTGARREYWCIVAEGNGGLATVEAGESLGQILNSQNGTAAAHDLFASGRRWRDLWRECKLFGVPSAPSSSSGGGSSSSGGGYSECFKASGGWNCKNDRTGKYVLLPHKP